MTKFNVIVSEKLKKQNISDSEIRFLKFLGFFIDTTNDEFYIIRGTGVIEIKNIVQLQKYVTKYGRIIFENKYTIIFERFMDIQNDK